MSQHVKRVAIIGAGTSGLPAIKSCLDEEGLEPVCFERSTGIGGLWRFSERVQEGVGSVMRSTINNISKEMTCYSDFPMPKENPNFMRHTQFLSYLETYSQHFQLQQHIRHRTQVKRVSPAPDYQTSGKWTLQVEDLETGSSSTEVFDAVMVCSGHHASQYQPSFPGQDRFQGQVLHSHDYRDCSGFSGKRVVVVGVGNSGCDIAVELGRSGQVFLSTRRGAWILHRSDSATGTPFDVIFNQRVNKVLGDLLPTALFHRVLARRMTPFLSQSLTCLTPSHSPWAQAPTINDDLDHQVAVGNVKVKPNIKRFTGARGVEFEDGSFEDNIDLVVMSTGYTLGFPFLDPSIVEVKDNRLPFYKYMFHPDLPHPTLAIIAGPEPIGGTMPMAEMQTRVAARVFKGDAKLPSSSQMWADIHAREKAVASQFIHSPRHFYQVNYVPYMDELADMIGCKPDLVSLLKSDPSLALRVLCGPCSPYQYRLQGPGQWEGARHAVMTTMDRVLYPLSSTRTTLPASTPLPLPLLRFVLWGLALMVIMGIGMALY